MNKNTTDYDIILKDFNKIWDLKIKTQQIMLVKEPKYKSGNNHRYIGKKTAKFTYENYIERYNECDSEENWQVKLLDDSLISFFYGFNNCGEILEYSLSFIPGFDEGAVAEVKPSSEIFSILTPCFNDYIRIDFSNVGYKPGVHENHHLHKGLVVRHKLRSGDLIEIDCSEDDSFRNEFRIPINNIMFPLDFIYFIIKYIYNDEDSLKSIIIDESYTRKNLIRLEEQDFSINNNFKVKDD